MFFNQTQNTDHNLKSNIKTLIKSKYTDMVCNLQFVAMKNFLNCLRNVKITRKTNEIRKQDEIDKINSY